MTQNCFYEADRPQNHILAVKTNFLALNLPFGPNFGPRNTDKGAMWPAYEISCPLLAREIRGREEKSQRYNRETKTIEKEEVGQECQENRERVSK